MEASAQTWWIVANLRTRFVRYSKVNLALFTKSCLFYNNYMYFYCSIRMMLDTSMSLQEQWMLVMMTYGAQSDEFDYHKVKIKTVEKAFLYTHFFLLYYS
jgi:hypothetical protein